MTSIYRRALTLIALIGLLAACTKSGTGDLREILVFSIDEIYTPAPPLPNDNVSRGNYSTADERLSAMECIADDGLTELWFCNLFLEIAVRDKSSGEIWFSTPFDLEKDSRAAGETKNNLYSLLRLIYYNAQQNEQRFSTFADTVPERQFGYRTIENGIEVQMLVGEVPKRLLVPPAAEANAFEELVLNQISSDRDRRRFLAYYTRYSWNGEMSQATRNSLLANYPGILEHDLYVLRGVNTRELKMLADMIAPTAYTWEDYENDLEISGSGVTEENKPVFKITVSFTLDNGSLVVNLPADKIEYDKSSYVLGSIHLLEYFGAGKGENDGYIFVPDGSGALINFNSDSTKSVAMTMLPVYGEDITFSNVFWRDNIRNAARLPVMGLREENKAWFAIIEEGEAMADIVAMSSKFFSGYESASLALYYGRNNLVTLADDSGARGSYRFTDKNFYQGNWTIRYNFLTGSEADYNGMAHIYQKYLIDRGIITPLEKTEPTLYLDVLGLYQKPDTYMGIPYSRRISLTTFDQAEDILADMHENGVSNAILRYRGWFNGGLNHTVPYHLNIERDLGGSSGLSSLTQTASSLGYEAYFDIDFNIIRRTGLLSGYNRLFNGPLTIDGYQVLAQPLELVGNAGGWNFYAVSPNHTTKLYEKFTKELVNTKINGFNISISNAGTTLLADYHRRRPVNLQQSRDIMVNNLNSFTETMGSITIDGGNAYALPFTKNIINIPMASSSHINTDASIPFMQLVLHGYVSFSGQALNMSYEPELSLLKNVEFGAAPSFTLAYGNSAELKGSPYSAFFSIDYHAWHDIMMDMYHRFEQAYSGLSNVPMERHDQLTDGVYMTTFANGARIYVNYNKEEAVVMANGSPITLAPRSFEVR